MAASLIKTSSELATLIVALEVFKALKMLTAFSKMLNILRFTSGPCSAGYLI